VSRYKNAAEILPADLLADLQRYAAGEQIYVPRLEERRPWGERSGAREVLQARNEQIGNRYAEGARIEQLMTEFHLGYDSIRKILNGKTGKNQSTHSRC
jgi:Mor family transcriptional regulator